MKLICDCGNEGEFYKLGTMYTLCVCKECGRRIYF